MQLLDSFGLGHHKDFVAPFEVGAPKVTRLEVLQLQVRAGSTVVDQNSVGESRKIRVVGAWSGKGRLY